MKKELFRKESLENLNSPEKITEYLKVTNTPVWIILSAIIMVIIGFVVWGIVAKIDGNISPIDLFLNNLQ